MATSTAPHTGTTIVACAFEGGVVLGADGRVSLGSYICNRASSKIAPLGEFTFILRSGSAPDTQIISDYGALLSGIFLVRMSPLNYDQYPSWCWTSAVSNYVDRHETELGHSPTVAAVATLVRQV